MFILVIRIQYRQNDRILCSEQMNRRSFLRGSGVACATAIAGCLSGLFDTRSALAPPLVEDRPSAVYYPTHTEGMKTIGLKRAKEYTIGLMYSYPHRFWNITSDRRNKEEIRSEDSIHLMGSVWDTETNTVLPTANLWAEITTNGERVTSKHLWPMLSQTMGYHFGDNIALSGDGMYAVTVRFGPVDVRRTGAFRDLGESMSTTFEFEYSRENREKIMFKRLDEKKGQREALDPMQMKQVPLAQLLKPDGLPGRRLGTATSGDGVFAVTTLDTPPTGIDNTGPYLAISARTPYNRYPLPFMSLSMTLSHGDSTVFDGPLVTTLDPELGYHYGVTVDQLRSGDTLTLTVDAPPQVSRHEGYETAFLDMPPMKLTIP